MKLSSSILTQFTPAAKVKLKPRPTVGSHCLTLDFAKAKWVMIGVPDDKGIENNHGRTGAKNGPKAFREMFFYHTIVSIAPAQHSIYDLGDLKLSRNLFDTLDRLKKVIAEILKIDPKKKIFIIGGGHDIAYSEIAGCLPEGSARKKHHIVNIDAHSDVRPLEKGNIITSGTPFYRLIEEEGVPADHYHPFGLQQASNNAQLVKWMKEKKVKPVWLEDMIDVKEQSEKFTDLLNDRKGDPWHFSIDLDGFPLSFAPGVSAPAVMGVSPQIFLKLDRIKSFSTLKSFGIYELSPDHDLHGSTARLAAKLAYLVLCKAT